MILAQRLRMLVGTISQMALVDHTAANNTTVSYPSDIRAGDLLIGLTNTDPSTSFRAASGFTSQIDFTDAGTTVMCTKIADGTETGAIGGFTGVASPIAEACIVMRGNRPVTSISKLLSGGHRAPGTPTTLSIAGSGTSTVKPRLAIFAFSSSLTFDNSNISFTGAGFHSQNYVEGVVKLKSRTKLWKAGETGEDIDAIKYNTGSDNAVWGAIFELN